MKEAGSNNIERSRAWVVPTVFFVVILAKILLFHLIHWPLCDLKSAISEPTTFWSFYLLKISPALIIASFAFFFRRKGWTVVFSFVFDIWIFINLLYFRSNGLCLDGYSSTLAGNLKGFWGGILAILEWIDLIFIALSVLYMEFVEHYKGRSATNWKAGLAALALGFVLHFSAMAIINNDHEGDDRCMDCFSGNIYKLFPLINNYCYSFSVAHMFIYDITDLVRIQTDREKVYDFSLTPREEEILSGIYHPELASQRKTYSDTVVFVLVESLENWAVRDDVMPNLSQLTRSEHVLYAPHIKRQIKAGTSSDGQMILNTGLLPIDRAAVCFSYPDNVFPSVAGYAKGLAATVIPHPDEVWNQKTMSVRYGYDITLERSEEDSDVFGTTLEYIRNGFQAVQVLTMSSHVPFNFGAQRSHLKTPRLMPKLMANYIKCMNYTDENLDMILSQTKEGGLLHNATIVITGDHTIFYREKRTTFSSYNKLSGSDYNVSDAFCPLVIYSPHIEGNVVVPDECYQMDVYSTLMGLLGDPDPVWDGFGIDLYHGGGRAFTEDEAAALSNKLIRNDYFSTAR